VQANQCGNQFSLAKEAHANVVPKGTGMVKFGCGNPSKSHYIKMPNELWADLYFANATSQSLFDCKMEAIANTEGT
jgi:hypothetical protein